MAAVFERLRKTFPPVCGVVHAAGVVAPKALRDLRRDAFEDTMDHSERLFRDWVRRLPDGVYEFTDYGVRFELRV